MSRSDLGISGRIAAAFLESRMTPLLALVAFLLGIFATLVTPREEEPQIVVPLADVLVDAPGLPVEEVERQVSTRLEKLLAQIDGVEYVYSMSLPGRAVVTVRFYVGEDREKSLVKIYNKIESNRDVVPPAVTGFGVPVTRPSPAVGPRPEPFSSPLVPPFQRYSTYGTRSPSNT